MSFILTWQNLITLISHCLECKENKVFFRTLLKNLAYGRHWIFWPMRIVAPIPKEKRIKMCSQKGSTKKCPQKGVTKSVDKKCWQKLLTISVDKKWQKKVFTQCVHKKCPQKLHPMVHTHRKTDGYFNSKTESGPWANSVNVTSWGES